MRKLDQKTGKWVEFVPEASDPRYLRGMAKMLSERGYPNLAQAHLLWAKDLEEVRVVSKQAKRPRRVA